jgi:isoleucyl-tRNA synthetase
VHLADWPDASELPFDAALVAQMDRVRDACSVGLSLREAHLLQDELNVKVVAFATT